MSRRRRRLLSSTAINVVLDGELPSYVTFTRASSGTYFDSAGVLQTATTNEARNHYLQDGSGLNGLLIEEARTNILLYSEQFDDATWAGNTATITANSVAAPDGTLTADTATFTGTQLVRQTVTGLTNPTTLAPSIFIRAAAATTVNIRQGNTAAGFEAKAVTTSWQRIEATVGSNASTSFNFDVQGTDTEVYIWGGQLEAGSYATSYSATTSASVTRAADVASIDLTAVSWFNATEGALYVDATLTAARSFAPYVVINDGSAVNRLLIYTSASTSVQGLATVASAAVAAPTVTGVTTTDRTKAAFGYKVNDYNIAVNGGLGTLDTSGAIPTGLTDLFIGRNSGGTLYFGGIISNIRYYNTRLTDANLQVLTT